MEQIRWNEKCIEFRNLVDNSTIKKPTLVQIGNQATVVGIKISGQFIVASPCRSSNDQFIPMEQELILSSKHLGTWKVIYKGTLKKRSYIHRLTTTDIERIYILDAEKERSKLRSYICMKSIEAFDLTTHNEEDITVADGQRIDRKMKRIEENVEFEVYDIGEVEYTPREGERTSQDYVAAPKIKTRKFPFLMSSGKDRELLIRNRLLRTLYCVTKNETHQRRFLLEVNEQPCDIRPIASTGSTELRYLQSTQNLFNYILSYDNTIPLCVKLIRGELPVKAADVGDYLIFRRVLTGDHVPLCCVRDLKISLASPDLPLRLKLPIDENRWHSIPEVHSAELVCMQLSLALFSRFESEVYVRIEGESSVAIDVKSNNNRKSLHSHKSVDFVEKQVGEWEVASHDQIPTSKSQNSFNCAEPRYIEVVSAADKTMALQQATKMLGAKSSMHPVSDMLYRDHDRRLRENDVQCEQEHSKSPAGRSNPSQRKTTRDKSKTSSLQLLSSTAYQSTKK
ncbi:unnamed protein product [Rotaria socialis]|uniref:CABIT domain-containing protein n=1 Tax=Rotaria socialis TaxID=392032 RepID=A0A820VI69_9BILA|nr:unnamed protein product [Rotaria socialis]CAF4500603.1 unnamed protein product [Rotaria socialis]